MSASEPAAKQPEAQRLGPRPALTHRQAVGLMLLITLLWSMAGVVTKRLESAASFEVTFWRSAFTVVTMLALLLGLRGPRQGARSLFQGGWPMIVASLCWSVMFTAFMVALTLTTVANVLVTLALGPLFTALAARLALQHALPMRTWLAMLVAGAGIAWMVGEPVRSLDTQQLLGIGVALAVPTAAAVNWTLMQWLQETQRGARSADMLPAVFWGAVVSTMATLPGAWPLVAGASDLAWLALLGSFQLAIPCLLSVVVARVLKAPELSLLALCEVVFGVSWAWLGTSEAPSAAVVWGGGLVIGAIAADQWLSLRQGRPIA